VRIRAVLFDVGETLVHPAPSFPALFSQVLEREGHSRDEADVLAASSVVLERFSEASREREAWTLSPGSLPRVLDRRVPAHAGLARAAVGERPPRDPVRGVHDLDNYALFDDVHPVLASLREQGVGAGIVSNFEAWLEDLLDHLGVREQFPVRVISGLEGMEKPDLEIYARALERLGLPADQVAFVGDNPEFDVVPPMELGMTAVLIDRRERHPDHDGTRITDLRGLPRSLEAAS
jgi:putative hydrolase of the HAD superfamily